MNVGCINFGSTRTSNSFDITFPRYLVFVILIDFEEANSRSFSLSFKRPGSMPPIVSKAYVRGILFHLPPKSMILFWYVIFVDPVTSLAM